MSPAEALMRRYLEHSPSALQCMIVIDVDHPDALIRAFEKPLKHPPVSWVAESPTGRGHIGWILKTPIVRSDAGRLAPLRYAARVEEGCRLSVDGDVGYAGLLTKNPFHEEWDTTWGTPHLYDLREMADALGELMPRSLPRRAADNSGLGRNCALFNRVRLWSYRARLRYDDCAEWEEVAHAYATAVNWEFAVPLPAPEVAHTARSVARWTWRNFSAAKFSEIQSARGRKGARKGGLKGGKVMSDAKREANRVRATKVDRAAFLEDAFS